MPFIDESTLDRIAESARQARAEVLGLGESTVQRTKDLLEIGGTAAALGYANARWGQDGELAVAKVPAELIVALTGFGLSLSGWAGQFDRDAEMIGAGALASYLSRRGAQFGAHQKAAATQGLELVGGQAPAQFGPAAQAGYGHGGKSYVVAEMK